MPVSYFDLQDLADKTCLSLPSAEKELFHNIMLHSLFSIKNKLARHLAFKGGTCLYKCYGLPRFSEDLDFDIAVSRSMKKKIKARLKSVRIEVGCLAPIRNVRRKRSHFHPTTTSTPAVRSSHSNPYSTFNRRRRRRSKVNAPKRTAITQISA